jgi:hypothetical protein
MKKMLAALMLIPSIGWAQVFVAPNQNGGEIVLTSRPCVVNNKNFDLFREAYAWAPTTRKMNACWSIRDGNVVLIYLDDGEERIYPFSGFKERK